MTLHADTAYNAGMKRQQYTFRNVPERLDRLLRARAASEGKSINATALHVLAIGLGVGDEVPKFSDLDGIAGSWIEDPAVDAALRDMDTVDRSLWS